MNQQDTFVSLSKYLWLSAIAFLILSLFATVIKIFGSSELSALHYNIILGVTNIGSKYQLLKLPATGLIITLINFSLARFARTRLAIFPLLLAVSSVLVNLVIFLATIFLLQVS